jgi:hypothetical protein
MSCATVVVQPRTLGPGGVKRQPPPTPNGAAQNVPWVESQSEKGLVVVVLPCARARCGATTTSAAANNRNGPSSSVNLGMRVTET